MLKTELAVGSALLLFTGLTQAQAQTVSAQQAQAAQQVYQPQWPDNPATQTLDMLRDKYGVNLRGAVINETAGNPAGGERQASTNVGQAQLGADFNLQKILGLPGGSVHITEYHDYGSSLSLKGIGNGVRVQEIYKNPYNIFHFGLFTYEQTFWDDKIDVEVGRTATSKYFAHLNSACAFMSGTNCGIPALANSEAGFSLLPSATWGGKVSYQVTPELYVMTGAFEVNSSVQPTSGFDWRTDKSTGVTVPIEAGYGTTFKTSEYPFDAKVGFYYSNGGHANPYYNTAGLSLGTFGGTAATVPVRTGMYILGDKTVWRADHDSHRNISLLGGWVQPFDNTEIYTSQAFLGAVWTGPFASRPNDSIGLIANYFRLGDLENQYLTAARVKAGSFGTNDPNIFTFELDYNIKPLPGLTLTPDLQYIVNPDNSALAKTNAPPPRNAVVIGLRAELLIGDQHYPSSH